MGCACLTECVRNTATAESELTEVPNRFEIAPRFVRLLGRPVLDATRRRDMSCLKIRQTTMSTRETFCEMFERHTRDRPSRAAVHFRGRDTSYAEINDQAARIATWLGAQGLERADRVVLLLANCPEYIAWYLGVQRSGGVVVALNPETTPRELAATLAHASPRIVVFGPRAADAFVETTKLAAASLASGQTSPGSRVRIAVSVSVPADAQLGGTWHAVRMDEVLDSLPAPLSRPPGLDDLAQLIYTSGTTGRPKGVTLTHRNLAANCNSILSYLRLAAEIGRAHV